MQRPFIPILIAVIVGITIGYIMEIPDHVLLFSLILAFSGMFIALRKQWKCLLWFMIMTAMCLMSILAMNLELYQKPGPQHITRYIREEKLFMYGTISTNPQVSPDKLTLIVSVFRIQEGREFIPVDGNVLLNVVTDEPFKYGDIIRFRAKLKIPHNFNNPGGFDYERYLRCHNILVRGFINNPADIIVLRENQGNPLKLSLEIFRSDLKKLIRENSPSPYGEIVQAMILGDQKEIPPEVMDKFNQTGTSHIIAISGFNVGIIAIFSIFLFRILMKSSEVLLLKFNIVKISTALSFIPIAVFTFIAGMGVSVVRATIMALTFLIAILLGKVRDLYNTLALAALIILVISPPSLFDISFQLSFMAVAAILFMTPILTALVPKPDPEQHPRYKRIAGRVFYDTALFLIVSVSATLGTMPLVVFYFNRVSAVSLLANLIVVPIMGVVALPVCMAIILAAPLSSAFAILLIKISTLLVQISVALVDFFSSLPGSSFFVTTPTLFEIAAYYLLMIVAFKLIEIRTDQHHHDQHNGKEIAPEGMGLKIVLSGLLLFFFVSNLYHPITDLKDKRLRITAIDVGQGASTLVQFPQGKKMLIDGGGFYEDSFDIGKYVVAPYLWHEKIRKIDVLVLTHVHPDHLNGLIFIAKNFKVEEVWMNGQISETEPYQEFKRIIREKNIHRRFVSAETSPASLGGVIVKIFNPEHPIDLHDAAETFEDINNQSIVMKLIFGKISVLLPADISSPSEDRLIHTGIHLRSDILFVPHHGGFTSSTLPFLNAVEPRIAVASSGYENVFRDPHPDVLQRYEARKVKIFRTDRDGAVTITTDGQKITIDTFKERHPATLLLPGSPEG